MVDATVDCGQRRRHLWWIWNEVDAAAAAQILKGSLHPLCGLWGLVHMAVRVVDFFFLKYEGGGR